MRSHALTNSELETLSAAAPHGTHARYNAHVRAGEDSCDLCLEAEAEYRAELRARRRESTLVVGAAVSPPRLRPSRAKHQQVHDERPIFEDEHDEAFEDEIDEDIEDEDDEDQDDDDLDEDDEDQDDDDLDDVDDDQTRSAIEPDLLEASAERTLNLMSVLTGARSRATPRPSSRSHGDAIAARSRGPDPGARLRAITARLDSTRPRGAAAVELLVEAVPLLKGGITALAQYGEARGCDAADVAAAERAARTRP